ncbi:hypothetical protein [Flavobacterium sp.]|uniref:DUF6913 domain-containing protein n=1 Tax=Flavobacterium sp. TaxID=239 RepID=UPI0026299BFF|nr:hypothetical protein [Flavobacterium sp.]
MFLDKIKDFWAKKNVKKRLSNVKHNSSNNYIKKVGLLIDESYFLERDQLINELIQNGIQNQNIELLVFRDKIKKNEVFDYSVFSPKDMTWNGTFDKEQITTFTNANFDLLISYYDIEKAPLILVTLNSKADFKVGFSSVDMRLNQFMIDTNAEKYKVFVSELFKYLKILNKL